LLVRIVLPTAGIGRQSSKPLPV